MLSMVVDVVLARSSSWHEGGSVSSSKPPSRKGTHAKYLYTYTYILIYKYIRTVSIKSNTKVKIIFRLKRLRR